MVIKIIVIKIIAQTLMLEKHQKNVFVLNGFMTINYALKITIDDWKYRRQLPKQLYYDYKTIKRVNKARCTEKLNNMMFKFKNVYFGDENHNSSLLISSVYFAWGQQLIQNWTNSLKKCFHF